MNKVHFEDILELVGGFGAWQKFTILLTCISGMLFAINGLLYVYDSKEPAHWCKIEELKQVNWTLDQVKEISIPREEVEGKSTFSQCTMFKHNYSAIALMSYEDALEMTKSEKLTAKVPCNAWEYDVSTISTTVIEWDMVCNKKALRPTIQAVYHFGILFSGIISGLLADKFGRRKIILLGIMVLIPLMFSSAIVSNYFLFIIIRFLVGFTNCGLYISCYVLVMEIVSTRHRPATCAAFDTGTAMGIMISSGMSYFLPNWRHLHLASGGLSCILIMCFCLVPESPRWLLLKGKLPEAEKILMHAAKRHNRKISSSGELTELMTQFVKAEMASTTETLFTEQNIFHKVKRYLVFWRTPEMRSRSLIIFGNWLVAGFAANSSVYLGIRLPIGSHLFLLISGFVKFIWQLLSIWPLNFFGRRNVFAAAWFFAAVLVITYLFTLSDYPHVASICMLLATFAYTINFMIIYLYTAELFPTEARCSSISIGASHSRVGAILAPYAVALLTAHSQFIPGSILTVVTCAAGLSTLLLPRTKGKKLPETVEEVEEWRRKKQVSSRKSKQTNGEKFPLETLSDNVT